jgi:hypothetical protein
MSRFTGGIVTVKQASASDLATMIQERVTSEGKNVNINRWNFLRSAEQFSGFVQRLKGWVKGTYIEISARGADGIADDIIRQVKDLEDAAEKTGKKIDGYEVNYEIKEGGLAPRVKAKEGRE